VDMTRK